MYVTVCVLCACKFNLHIQALMTEFSVNVAQFLIAVDDDDGGGGGDKYICLSVCVYCCVTRVSTSIPGMYLS